MSDEYKYKAWKEVKLPFDMSNGGSRSSIGIDFKLGDRLALCVYCAHVSKSDESLPHFKKSDGIGDTYYCGCRGWS